MQSGCPGTHSVDQAQTQISVGLYPLSAGIKSLDYFCGIFVHTVKPCLCLRRLLIGLIKN